jgi:hypothetical protein
MKQSADWFAWTLQFILGLFIGHTVGSALVRLVPSEGRLSDHSTIFAWGAALIGAGVGSFYGDRLWLSLSNRAIPPDRVQQNKTSRLLSMSTGTLGCLLVVTCLFLMVSGFGKNP